MRTALVAAMLAITHPPGVHITTRALTGITDPAQRFALYSGRFPNDSVRPQAHQIIAIVMEQEPPPRVDLALFPPRARRFHVDRLTTLEGFSGPRWAEIHFRDHGRAFYIFIGVGARADAQLPRFLTTLDSLRVGRH